MNEQKVMALMEQFSRQHLRNQVLMGFAVLDEEEGIIVASTLDKDYGKNLTNPIRRWIIQETLSGFRAFEMNAEDDFRTFAVNQFKMSVSA
jgi:hypothetical protein